jgi:hypothetical protein
MKFNLLSLSVAVVLGTSAMLPVFGQAPGLQFPAASPACTIKQRVGLTDIEVVYSRPSLKGRAMFGAQVPYGEVWRTGANSATKITFSTDVKLGGQNVPAGTYGLFTIPGEKEWTVIINKGSGQWGAYQYDEKADLVRFKVAPIQLAKPLETFTIEFNELRDESATLSLVWDRTLVPVKLEVNVKAKLVPEIEKVMASSEAKKPYFQAAVFYYEHGQDLDKAAKWMDAAVAENEAFYIVHWKAKILARQGKKAEAITAANRSKELALKAKDSAYVKMNDELLASLK